MKLKNKQIFLFPYLGPAHTIALQDIKTYNIQPDSVNCRHKQLSDLTKIRDVTITYVLNLLKFLKIPYGV